MGWVVGVEQLRGDPQPPARPVVAGAEASRSCAVDLLGELARVIAPASARGGQLQVRRHAL